MVLIGYITHTSTWEVREMDPRDLRSFAVQIRKSERTCKFLSYTIYKYRWSIATSSEPANIKSLTKEKHFQLSHDGNRNTPHFHTIWESFQAFMMITKAEWIDPLLCEQERWRGWGKKGWTGYAFMSVMFYSCTSTTLTGCNRTTHC